MSSSSSPLKVSIDLAERSYDIFIGEHLLENASQYLQAQFPKSRFGIITDDEVAKFQLKRLTDALDGADMDYFTHILPHGEATKRIEHLNATVEAILSAKLERTDVILALGGGVIGDLAGFAASIARRGMPFVQMPTSLLAQVDSSVGGKTGINAPHGKNLIGAFHQPSLVLADLQTLETLPKRQFAAGYAEVAKYGLIDDADLFFWLEENLDEILNAGPARAEAIARCCAAKARFVIADETEQGMRALLNLGHTFGHALEKVTGYSDRLLHGEGVSIGMVLAHAYSAKIGIAPGQDVSRVSAHLSRMGLPTRLADIPGELASTDALLDAITQDKKVTRGQLNFILTRGIGKAFISKNVDAHDIHAFLEEMRNA